MEKVSRSRKLHEGKDEYYGDGIENLKKVDITRLNYGLDVLCQALNEGLISDSTSKKVAEEFIRYIDNSESYEGWYAVKDDYEQEYDKCVAFSLIPNNYYSLDSYIEDDDAYVAFAFDYGALKGDKFYLCLSANSSESDFSYNNIQIGGTTCGLDRSGKFVVTIDKVESTWKSKSLFPNTNDKFKDYE